MAQVKFLPGGSLPPEEFLARVNARWGWTQDSGGDTGATAVVCIAELESIEQLSLDVSIMPGAGIASIELFPLDALIGAPDAPLETLP